MTWRRPNLLLLLVGLTLIRPSQEHCNDYFDQKSWKNPPQRVALIRTNSSMDVMECSLERLYIQHNKLYPILRDCFERPDVTQISEKCEGETYADVQFIHFMCWLAKAAAVEPTPDYCDDYESLCQIYSEILFPPRRDQTTLPPTTNARTTPPESTTNATTTLPESTTVTTAPLPLTTTTTPPESTTNATTLPESTTITTTTTTTLQTATTKTTKATPIPTGSNSGRMAAMEISQGNLTLMIFLAFFVIMTVVLLFVYLRMRRRMQLMMQQNVLNEVSFQAESQSIANMANTANMENTRGPEQAFLMQPPNNPQA